MQATSDGTGQPPGGKQQHKGPHSAGHEPYGQHSVIGSVQNPGQQQACKAPNQSHKSFGRADRFLMIDQLTEQAGGGNIPGLGQRPQGENQGNQQAVKYGEKQRLDIDRVFERDGNMLAQKIAN